MDIPMSIVIEKTPFGLGFTLKDEGKPYESTALVTKVARGSSAEASGLRIGDRIVAINQKPVKSMTFLEVSNFLRSGSDRNIQLTLLHKSLVPNQPITDTMCELSPLKILTSSNIANGIQNMSLKDSNSAFLYTTNASNTTTITTDVYKDEMNNSPDCTSSVVSNSQLNKPIPKPRTTTTNTTTATTANTGNSNNCKELLNSQEIKNLDKLSNNLLHPVLSQFQESEFDNSSTNNLLSDDFLSTSEARKENSCPPDSIQLMNNSPTGTDKTPTKIKSIDHNLNTFESSKKSGYDSVRIIRKHTIDPSYTEDVNTDTLPVRFIRKRAYASTRHPGRYDQVKTITSMNITSTDNTITTSNTTESQPVSVTLSKNVHTSPCQLLPAVNASQKNSINNYQYNTEPKIIHLPRRRSSTNSGSVNQGLHSKHQMNVSSFTRDDNNDDEHDYLLDKQPFQTGTVNIGLLGKDVSNVYGANISYSSPKEDSSMPCRETYTNKSNYISVGTSHRSSKTSLLSSRLWASFDQDQNESVSDLWTRAGEMYHILEQESQRLANKKTITTTNTTSMSTTTTTTSSSNSSSRKSKTHRHPGIWDNYQQMNSLSDGNDKNTVKNLEFSSQLPYYSSPIPNCHKDMSTKAAHYNSHCSESSRDHTNVNSTKKRLQFRSLCSGLRSHRSESNILCDMSGSFLSRQCFCKILTIGGSDNKSYSWKPYYMRVSGAEVKFIKASWAFHGTGRTAKTSKHKNDIIYPRNNSLGSLRDNLRDTSQGTLDTSKSHDDLNDDSMTYYYPVYNTDIDYSNNMMNVNKSFNCNASCLILPIPGLIWCSEQLPANFPNWLPLGCNSNHHNSSNSTQTLTSRIASNNNNSTSGINPDWMDPHVSGLSQQILSDFNDYYKLNTVDFQNTTTTTTNNNNVNMNDEVSSRSKFRCYRFAHLTAGVELLFVFPDENAAMTCLKMCQLSGGRDYDCIVEQLGRCDHRNASTLTTHRKKSSSNPYELFFLKLPSSSLSEIPMKLNQGLPHNFTIKGSKYRVPPLANNDDDDDVNNEYTGDNNTDDFDQSMHRDVFIQPRITNLINTDSPYINTTYGPYSLMKDKRRPHRRYVIHQSSIGSDYSNAIVDGEDVNSIKNNKSDVTNKFRTRTREKIDLDGIRSDNTETMTNDISINNSNGNQTTSDVTTSNINSNVDDKSHPISLIRTNKILRGFKQWLQRPVGVNNNNNNSNHNNASSTSNSTSTNCPSVGSINFSTANNPTNTMNNVVNSTTGYFSGSCGGTANSSVNYHNVNSNNNCDISSTVDVSHLESPNNEHKFSSLMTVVDPPNMTDLDSPGPVFGAPLESQLESPDYPCVPVLLQAIVVALEIHGLSLPGLYRKPGRHRTIAQFISSVNLHPEDIDLMFSLDAWREPNALCGLFKHFLRRLPVGLFSLSSWEPLFCLVPEIGNSSDMKQLAYLLLSIRVQLKKMAFDAFGIPIINAMPVDVQNNSPTNGSIECQFSGVNSISDHLFKPSISPPISPQTIVVPSNTSQLQLKEEFGLTKISNLNEKEFNISKQSFRVWRWATLCFIMNHITRVVAHEQHNAVTYQCIAICFGPVFFGNSSKLPKLNEVLEHLFRHWKWLIDGLPMITKSPNTNIDFSTINEPTLIDAITYLTTINTTDKSKQQKKPILQNHHNNNHIQRLDLTPEPRNNDTLLSSSSICSSTRRKSADVILSQQSSTSSCEQEQQLIIDYDLTVKKFDNEDELNKEVIEQIHSLWLRALDKMNNQSHRDSQMKEKSSNHKKTTNHSNTTVALHRTVSAIPKKSTERHGQKGVRRLTVGVANFMPHSSSTLDYYDCISPPSSSSQLLYTKTKEEDTLLTQLNNVKNISNLSSSLSSPPSSSLSSTSPPPPPPTTRCDLMIVRRPVIPVTTSHTTTTIS
uniref:PDZ domain-containing protein n=1 Tax=Schistosoma mansoni TaxID=6183 RepID=A0A3Q0KVB8_SCHMA